MPEHRRTGQQCDDSGVQLEFGGLEIDTDPCPYAVLQQPLLVDLRRGRTIELLAWHNELLSVEPAEGHMLLSIDGTTVWQWTVSIPAPADVWDAPVISPDRFAHGAPVVLHLHNHGANAWNLNQVVLGQ